LRLNQKSSANNRAIHIPKTIDCLRNQSSHSNVLSSPRWWNKEHEYHLCLKRKESRKRVSRTRNSPFPQKTTRWWGWRQIRSVEFMLKGQIVIHGLSVCSLYLATHGRMDSSTALDRSRFLPPNLSMVLNLSFFSSSSGSSTRIRPISITYYQFFARFARVRSSSNKQIAICRLMLSFPLSLYINPFAYPRNILYAY
jgi:hypothetical protein